MLRSSVEATNFPRGELNRGQSALSMSSDRFCFFTGRPLFAGQAHRPKKRGQVHLILTQTAPRSPAWSDMRDTIGQRLNLRPK
jgi:hypothetical protein